MCYQGQNGTEREPKIFDYCELESFIPRLCDLYGAPLKMGEISWVVEQKLYPPLYHYGKEIPWPEYFGDESVEEGFHASSRDLLACSEFSWEEELLAHDVLEKLGPSLTSDEDRIRQGLEDGESMRSLAELCGCSPGTVEHRRQELARKAARLDPSVQDASDYLERRSQRENDSSLKKRRRDGG